MTVPTSVTAIGDSAFMNCTNLESVTLPSTVTSIGKYAFSTTNMKSFDLSGFTSISEGIFEDCTNLNSVILPENCEEIPDNAFAGTALKQIDLPLTENIVYLRSLKAENDIFLVFHS